MEDLYGKENDKKILDEIFADHISIPDGRFQSADFSQR